MDMFRSLSCVMAERHSVPAGQVMPEGGIVRDQMQKEHLYCKKQNDQQNQEA